MTTRTRTETMRARIGLSLMVGLLMICGGGQLAQAAPRRLGVPVFRGPGEGATRNAVMKAAKAHKYQVVGGQQIAAAAKKLKVTLDTNDAFQSVAKELGISGFVTGEVTKKKATMTVRNGADGSVSAEASWTGPNPRKLSVAVGKTFWRRLGSAIERTKAPGGAKAAVVAEEAAAPETGADDDSGGAGEGGSAAKKEKDKDKVAASDEPDREASGGSKKKKKSSDDESGSETVVSEKADLDDEVRGASGESLVLSIGPRVLNRSLRYVDDVYPAEARNAKYSLAAAPEVGLGVDVYPAALAGSGGFVANLGITAAVNYMLPVVKSPTMPPMGTPGMGQYGTYHLGWSLGAKVRLPMGLYGTVAYGHQRYQLTAEGGAVGVTVPMVDYGYARVGAGARIHVTPDVIVMGNAAYLHCLSMGQIATAAYFPKATCAAAEVGAAIGYRLSAMLELQAGADLRRYGLAFHVTPADAQDPNRRIAGGAVDQYIMGYVALAVVLGGGSDSGGGGAASSSSDEEEAPKKADEKSADGEKGDGKGGDEGGDEGE